jgi:hypothetical protein
MICYGCKNILVDCEKSHTSVLPEDAYTIAREQVNRARMKETIDEFLIKD